MKVIDVRRNVTYGTRVKVISKGALIFDSFIDLFKSNEITNINNLDVISLNPQSEGVLVIYVNKEVTKWNNLH